jgi:hypothetical protein
VAAGLGLPYGRRLEGAFLGPHSLYLLEQLAIGLPLLRYVMTLEIAGEHVFLVECRRAVHVFVE